MKEIYNQDSLSGGTLLFREVQYFRNLPLMMAAMGGMAVVIVLLLFQVRNLSARDAPLLPVYVPIFIMALMLLLFVVMRLEVEVSTTSFRYRFFPFLPFWREFRLDFVESAEAVTYRPILEFGGWGIRYGRGMWAYTVSGNRGVVVRIRSGRTFMIGTSKPEELQRSLGRAV